MHIILFSHLTLYMPRKRKARKSDRAYAAVRKTKEDRIQDKRIKKIETTLRPEVKNLQTFYPGPNGIMAADTNAMVINSVTQVPQGTGSNARIGDVILIKKIDFKAVVWSNQPQHGQFVRFMVVRDKSYRGTDITATQLLYTPNFTDDSVLNAMVPTNPDYVRQSAQPGQDKEVTVLFDKTIYVPAYGGTGGMVPMQHCKFVKNYKKGLEMQYTGANERNGIIYVVVFPGADTTAASNPQYAYQCTIYYSDN